MRKLSRLFATKDAARGAAPRRRRKVAHLASAAESSAKLKAAAPADMNLAEDGALAMELEERAVAMHHAGNLAGNLASDLGSGSGSSTSSTSSTSTLRSGSMRPGLLGGRADVGMDETRDVLEGDVLEEDENVGPSSETSSLGSGPSSMIPNPPGSIPPTAGLPFDSGVYMSSRFANADPNLVRQVTLVVYEWHNVEPGTLSWVFPSVQAALGAARAMRNAVKWAIIAGRRTHKVDVESERASGLVLAEQDFLGACQPLK